MMEEKSLENRSSVPPPPLQGHNSEDASLNLDDVTDGSSKAQSSEEKIAALEKNIADLNADFGAKMATFKELYMKQEKGLTSEREAKKQLELKIKNLEDELNETKSRVTITENEIEIEKQKRQQDLTSLRMKFEDHVQSIYSKCEGELRHLVTFSQKLEGDLNEVKVLLLAASGNSDVGPVAD